MRNFSYCTPFKAIDQKPAAEFCLVFFSATLAQTSTCIQFKVLCILMFEFLSQKFSSIFSRLGKQSKLSQADIVQTLDQVRDAFLEADVPHEVVEQFLAQVKSEILGQQAPGALKPSEYLMKVVNDKLVSFLGATQVRSSFEIPSILMVLGLQGAGKTTAVGKLAHFIKKEAEKRGKTRRILLASVDYHRPAAIDQLEILAQQVGVTFYRAQASDALSAAQEIAAFFKKQAFEHLILDTAGRLHIDSAMLEQLRAIDAAVNPKYKLLVLDAMTGQESLNVARAFEQGVGFDGAIMSKMDSDARGGAALSFRFSLNKPIWFAGVGEKIDDLDVFRPDRVASRMLGMGDMHSLVERAQEKIKQSEHDRMYQSFSSGRLSLADFAQQMEMVGRLGSLSQLVKYLPGLPTGALSDNTLAQGEADMRKFKAIINSMTPKERLAADIINKSRRQRIAQGAGVSEADVDMLLKRFEQAQQYVKLFKKFGSFKNIFR